MLCGGRGRLSQQVGAAIGGQVQKRGARLGERVARHGPAQAQAAARLSVPLLRSPTGTWLW